MRPPSRFSSRRRVRASWRRRPATCRVEAVSPHQSGPTAGLRAQRRRPDATAPEATPCTYRSSLYRSGAAPSRDHLIFRSSSYLELTIFYPPSVMSSNGTSFAFRSLASCESGGESHENLSADAADRYNFDGYSLYFSAGTAIEVASAVVRPTSRNYQAQGPVAG